MEVFKKYLLLHALFLVLLSNGCATKGNSEHFSAQYYPSCHEPLEYLQQGNGGAAGKAVAKGAAQGALIAGLSSLVYGLINGKVEPIGILATTAAGATVGGTAAAFNTQYESREDTRQMAKYLEQIEGDISGINDVSEAAATVALQCYKKEFSALKTGMSDGQIDAGAGRKRFEEIIAGTREASEILKNNADVESMQKEFEASLAASPKI